MGDSDPDACMLAAAGVSIAFQPKSPGVERAADHVARESLLEILGFPGVDPVYKS